MSAFELKGVGCIVGYWAFPDPDRFMMAGKGVENVGE